MELLKGRRLATLRTAVVASLGVHGALIAGAALVPLGAPRVEAAEVVSVEVIDVVAPPEEPTPSAPPPPAAAAPRPRVAPRAAIAPTAAAAEPSAPAEETPAEPTAPVVPAGNAAPTGGPSAAVSGGVAGGVPGGSGAANRPVDDTQRRVSLSRYRELMRGRIGAAFQYPTAARELELAGEVIVEITVDRLGALRRARLHGPCPHALLCEDALRTVRAAAPFPALPPDLAGDAVAIDVPLRYDFE